MSTATESTMTNAKQLTNEEAIKIVSDGITADAKAAQIVTAAQPQDSDLTDLDELNILENKGIEYPLTKAGKETLFLYVKPLTLKEQRLILEVQAKLAGATELDGILLTTKIFSEIFEVSAESLEDYLTVEDIYIIFGLFACALYEGKKLFKKKKLPLSMLNIATNSIKSLLTNPGLLKMQSSS